MVRVLTRMGALVIGQSPGGRHVAARGGIGFWRRAGLCAKHQDESGRGSVENASGAWDLVRYEKRRDESGRGRHECPRHIAGGMRSSFGCLLGDTGGDPTGDTGVNAGAAPDMRLVLVAEVAQGGQYGVGSALAQSAETGVHDQVAEFLEQGEVGGSSFAGGDLLEDGVHLRGSRAAGG